MPESVNGDDESSPRWLAAIPVRTEASSKPDRAGRSSLHHETCCQPVVVPRLSPRSSFCDSTCCLLDPATRCCRHPAKIFSTADAREDSTKGHSRREKLLNRTERQSAGAGSICWPSNKVDRATVQRKRRRVSCVNCNCEVMMIAQLPSRIIRLTLAGGEKLDQQRTTQRRAMRRADRIEAREDQTPANQPKSLRALGQGLEKTDRGGQSGRCVLPANVDPARLSRLSRSLAATLLTLLSHNGLFHRLYPRPRSAGSDPPGQRS